MRGRNMASRKDSTKFVSIRFIISFFNVELFLICILFKIDFGLVSFLLPQNLPCQMSHIWRLSLEFPIVAYTFSFTSFVSTFILVNIHFLYCKCATLYLCVLRIKL